MRASLVALVLVACGARTGLPGPEPSDAGLDVGADTPAPPAATCAAAKGQMVVLAANQRPNYALAIDDGYVYWFDAASHEARRVPKQGGASQKIATDPTTSFVPFMAVDGTDLYWTTADALWRVAKSGGAPVQIADANGLALDAANVYSSDAMGSIYQRPKGGGPALALASGQSEPEGMAVDGSFVYWVNGITSSEPGVEKVPIGGGPVTSLAPVRNGSHIALDGGFVYFTQQDYAGGNPLVARVSKDGGGLVTLASGQKPSGIAVDDTDVWWTDYGANTVSRTPKAGGSTTVVATNQALPHDLAADAACVFWTTESVGASGGSIVAYGK